MKLKKLALTALLLLIATAILAMIAVGIGGRTRDYAEVKGYGEMFDIGMAVWQIFGVVSDPLKLGRELEAEPPGGANERIVDILTGRDPNLSTKKFIFFPKQLEDQSSIKKLVDAWGEELVFNFKVNGAKVECKIFSSGKNRVHEGGKNDDILIHWIDLIEGEQDYTKSTERRRKKWFPPWSPMRRKSGPYPGEGKPQEN